MTEMLGTAVSELAEIGEILFEIAAIISLLYAGVTTLLRRIGMETKSGIGIGDGIAVTLELLLAGEVLHTINAHEPKDLIFLAAMVAIRAAMTLEIHLELRDEKKEAEKHAHMEEQH